MKQKRELIGSQARGDENGSDESVHALKGSVCAEE
jgi:hypothetical protein